MVAKCLWSLRIASPCTTKTRLKQKFKLPYSRWSLPTSPRVFDHAPSSLVKSHGLPLATG